MAQLIPITTPTRVFEDRTQTIYAAADIPNSQMMVTSSEDRMVRLWDVETGEVLKQMKGHTGDVMGLAVSRNGQMIATGDENGELIAWLAYTGEPLTHAIKAHGSAVRSLSFSPDDAFVVTASSARNDQSVKFWNTKTWEQSRYYACGSTVHCVRYARSGVPMLAIATDQDIRIYIGDKLQTKLTGHSHGTLSLAWSPDRTRLLSGGDDLDPTIREWDTSSWTQVGDPWTGHTYKVNSISVHSSGTYAVSASNDNTVRLWQLSDKQTIAIFQHAASVVCAAFSADGTHILSGGYDKRVAVWTAPKGTLAVAVAAAVDASKELVSTVVNSVAQLPEHTSIQLAPQVQELALTQPALQTGSSNVVSLQPILTTGSFDLKSLQVVSTTDSSDFHSLQAANTDVQSQQFAQTGSSNVVSLQPILTTGSSDLKSLQAVSTTDSSDFHSLQAANTDVQSQQVAQIGSSTARSLQPIFTTESSDFKTPQAVSTTNSSDFDSLQAISTAATSDVKSLQPIFTTEGSDFKPLQAVSTTDSSDFDSLQAISTAANSDVKSQQFASTTASFDSKSQQSFSTTAQSISTVEQSLSNERSISKAEQSFKVQQSLLSMTQQSSLKSEQSVLKAEQGISKIEQGAFMAEQGIARVGQSAVQFEQDVSMGGAEGISKFEQGVSQVGQGALQFKQDIQMAGQGVSKFEQGISMAGQDISKKLTITTAELLATATTIRTAFIAGDLFTAEKVLTQDITADAKNFASYANRSFIMARKFDWNNALQDATKSLALQTSLPGYIAQGIAFCGKQLVDDARAAFDLAFTFTQGNMNATVFVYLIKAIALFNANRIKEALLRVDRLSADSSSDPIACGIVVASLRFQLGTIALNGGRHSEAVEHFTAAVEASTFLAQSAPPSSCEVFTVLFGWDIETLWQMSNQKLILALLGAGMLGEAFESYRFAIDASDETTKTNLQSWVLTLSL